MANLLDIMAVICLWLVIVILAMKARDSKKRAIKCIKEVKMRNRKYKNI